MPDRLVVVRADASPSIGLGHVMRSMTLAGSLAEAGATVEFQGAGIPERAHGWPTGVHLDRVSEVTHEPSVGGIAGRRPELVVVDGYHFSSEFFGELTESSIPYAVIDDNGDTAATDPVAVLNPNPHATEALYTHMPTSCRLLLGLEFALVSPAFEELASSPPMRTRDSAFVSIGGSDVAELTVPVATALAAGHHRQVRVAVGPAVRDRGDVIARLEQVDGVTPTSEADYALELATCEVAVLGAGSSLWEAATVGTPVVAIIVADNQVASAIAAAESGMVIATVDARETQDGVAGRVADLVEVHAADHSEPRSIRPLRGGARRAAEALLEAAAAAAHPPAQAPVSLRPASSDDSVFLFELRNDAEVVRASRSDRPVPIADHHTWLANTLQRADRRLFVVCAGGTPVGQARLDCVDDHEIVSIALAADHRGRGYGTGALRSLQHEAYGVLVAEVRPENRPSRKLFEDAGFVEAERAADGMVRLVWTGASRSGTSRRP